MPIARCITRYCITMKEDHQFSSWALQASHNATSWLTLHVGSEAFIGRRCFNFSNTRYYEYYRVKIYEWIGSAGIPELDFYEKVDDYTTTSSSYTTTTSTSTLTTTASTSHTHTTTTRITTVTTTLPIYNSLGQVTLTGNASNYILIWQSSSFSSYYEVQVRYNNGSYLPLLFTEDYVYQGQIIQPSINTIQFRVRYHVRDMLVSPWTESNTLVLSNVAVDFKSTFLGTESSSYLRVRQSGQRVQLTDLSVSDHGNIVSWLWTFYTDSMGKSHDNVTSVLQNPHYTYLTSGLYAVRLTVTDSTGRVSSLIKTKFIEVGCQVVADFVAVDINGTECRDYIEIPYGSTVRFLDTSGPGDIIDRQWQFYESENYGGMYQTAGKKLFSKVYDSPSKNYAVGIRVVGAYGQEDFIVKPSFVRVSKDRSTTTTTTTWATSTHTTTTVTTETTTQSTTSPPDNWLRIPMQGGIPLCSSYEIGYEPYRAFDRDSNTVWEPIYSTTTTTVTTTTVTTTTITSTITTTTDYFLSSRDDILLWTPDTDIDSFRQRFIRFVTSNNVYRVRELDILPSYNDRYEGMIVYELYHRKYYVGLATEWAQINPEYVLHVLSHTDAVDPVLKFGDQPPDLFPGVIWIKPDSTTLTTTLTTTTTATTVWIGNEALIGIGHYPQCSSFSVGHDCPYAFDGDPNTYWESNNKVTETSPEWIGFYWSQSKTIRWYKFFCSSHGAPTTWSIIASKNGMTWVDIDYRYLEDLVGWNWFAIDNSTDYKFYRILFYKTVDDNNPRVYALEMYQSVVTTTTSTESTATTGSP